MALTSPEHRGLYLVSEWQLNEVGDVTGPLPDTAGVMIMGVERIRSVRIMKGEDRGPQGHRKERGRRGGR